MFVVESMIGIPGDLQSVIFDAGRGLRLVQDGMWRDGEMRFTLHRGVENITLHVEESRGGSLRSSVGKLHFRVKSWSFPDRQTSEAMLSDIRDSLVAFGSMSGGPSPENVIVAFDDFPSVVPGDKSRRRLLRLFLRLNNRLADLLNGTTGKK
jgi:hypothetical protein